MIVLKNNLPPLLEEFYRTIQIHVINELFINYSATSHSNAIVKDLSAFPIDPALFPSLSMDYLLILNCNK